MKKGEAKQKNALVQGNLLHRRVQVELVQHVRLLIVVRSQHDIAGDHLESLKQQWNRTESTRTSAFGPEKGRQSEFKGKSGGVLCRKRGEGGEREKTV